MWTALSFLVCLSLSTRAQPATHLIQSPVVPNPSPAARALLHFLQTESGQHILSGQTEDTDNILWHKDHQGGMEIPFIHSVTGTSLEAERATALGGVSMVTHTNANFTGWGYVDLSGKQGTNYSIRWNTSVGSTTLIPLTFRFANGSTSTRYLHLRINGSLHSTLTFPPTGSWNLFSTITTPAISFFPGAVMIELVPSAGTSGPNIDKLEASLPSILSYEAEGALLEGGVFIGSSNPGYTGSGYADYPGNTGTGVRVVWTIHSEAAGNRELSFRYANGGTSARPLHLVVNGGSPILLNFDPTGAWNSWVFQPASAIPFNAGNNTIELRASAGSGGPNVDRLDLSVPGVFSGQAEDATLVNVSAAFVNTAFTGTGFAQFPAGQGSGVLLRWNLDLPEARTMPLAIRYANGSSSDRRLQLKINGANAAALTLPPSGDWTTYHTKFSPVLTLPAGANMVELVASAGTAGPYVDALQHSGKIPAVRAFDFIWDNQSTYDQYNNGVVVTQRNVQRAIEWWNEGGIVTWAWHWFIPKNGGGGTFGTDIVFDLNLATTPGTAEYDYLIADMDIAANNFKTLRDAGVPVLWRPFHEAAGRWFWWGKDGPDIYKKLWSIMFNRFTYHHGLNNLLWVCNAGSDEDWEWYPGDDTVNIISTDQYAAPGVHDVWADAWATYSEFNAPGKVLALSENGPIPDPAQLDAQSIGWSWFCTWASSFILNGQYNPVTNIVSFYHHPYVLNRGDLPNLKTLSTPAVGPATQLAFGRPALETALGFPPPRVVTVEPTDAAGRVARDTTGTVELRWEQESAPLVSAPLVRGVATFTLPVLQRPQDGQHLVASLAGLAGGNSPEVVVGPGSGYRWERWNYPGNLANDWNSQRNAILASTPDFTGDAAVSSAVPWFITTNDHFVVRLTGALIPPTNGACRFWVYGDDRAEFWLQTSLASSNLTKIAYNSQSQSKGQWDEETIQQSGLITLQAGKAYNFEFIMAEFGGNAHAAFGWTLPDGTFQGPIPGTRLQLPGGYLYDTWARREGLTGTNALFDADVDMDGRGNFLEFALGLSPTRADAEPRRLTVSSPPRFLLPIPSGDEVAMTIRSTSDLATGQRTVIATWNSALGWTIPPGVTDVSVLPATGELLDLRGHAEAFYQIEATPVIP